MQEPRRTEKLIGDKVCISEIPRLSVRRLSQKDDYSDPIQIRFRAPVKEHPPDMTLSLELIEERLWASPLSIAHLA